MLNKQPPMKEAETAYYAALAIYKQLAAAFPTSPELRHELARSHGNLGVLLSATGRLPEAETAYAAGLTIFKQLAAEFPKVPDYRNYVGGTMGNLASLANRRRNFALARRWLEDAQPHVLAALQADPRHPTYRQFYLNNLAVSVQSCAGQGDRAAVLEAAAKLRDLGWHPPGNAYDAACALALCVPIVEKDEKASKQERDKQMRFYADQAITMLRTAVAKGYEDAAHMKKDTDLDPLRSREDFKKLLSELEKKAEKTIKEPPPELLPPPKEVPSK